MSMGLTQMNSLLSLNNTMKSMDNMDSGRNAVQRRLKDERKQLAQAQECGADTTQKEEKIEELEGRLNSIEQSIGDTMKETSEKIAADSEKIHEEEAAKAKGTTRSEEAAAAPKSGETIVDGSSGESADTVDISVFAQNAAVFTPTPVPEIHVEQASQIGEFVDVKA